MLTNLSTLFLLFIIYSILGYFVEVIYVSIDNKKINLNRGFLIGPYLPIFGMGALIITIFLTKYKSDILILFIIGSVICGLLEYFTSLILEKIFKLRWWDYSNYKFNINGRVCLEIAALFGIGAIVIIEVFNPILYKLFNIISSEYIVIISTIIFLIFLIDFILTMFIMFRIKINFTKYINIDATESIREEVKKSLRKYIYLITRILNAFPNVQYIADSAKEKLPRINPIENKRFKAFEDLIFKMKNELKKRKNKKNN